ncbi:serine hydrolase domain-containing protein [Actinomadura mexicana]|uniref:D-alanyl-D-alanine carboxypeptidase n=1 Tax=Actinomadura mexicana TaxID=134959 RepID=A0A238W887_9ACTN|nr:serine hydrolase domain-containing protein [Actinomadura mexicana]SNR42504.1 D-alanyl-D-alanine carboxypeptidase [Actinomadura mexicana]
MRSRKFLVRAGATLAAAAATVTAVTVGVQDREATVASVGAKTEATTGARAGGVLKERVTRLQSEHRLPGVIGMARSGGSTQYAASGYGDMFRRVPADPKAKFRIASNTKAFVATVLLQLEAEGKLSMNDTVDRWLPGLVAANGNDGRKITIRQLLNHTSGLPDYVDDLWISGTYLADINPYRKWDPRALVKVATSRKSLSAPGAKFNYANTNYVLGGLIIQAATGHRPAAEVRDRIIKPLGLTDTTFPEADPKLYGNWLHGYFTVRDISFTNVQVFGAAGAMVSTQQDLADFTRALASGRLLPPAQQREMQQVASPEQPYGLGVLMAKTPCGTAWSHNGAVLGYFSQWYTSPDGKDQVVVATNRYNMIAGKAESAVVKTAQDSYCALRGKR